MAAAEAGEIHPALAHEGPWTEDAYLALPGDRRVELVDGSLLVAPTTGERHARAVAVVRETVERALPEELEIIGPVALRLSPGRILVPDLVVVARSDEPEPGPVRDGATALVVIDVVGKGNGVADRWFKPQLYAGSRIPYAVLIDHDGPFAVGNMLIGGRYHEFAQAGAGEALRLDEPFPLELDLDALVAALPGESDDDEAEASDGEPDTGPDTGPDADADATNPNPIQTADARVPD